MELFSSITIGIPQMLQGQAVYLAHNVIKTQDDPYHIGEIFTDYNIVDPTFYTVSKVVNKPIVLEKDPGLLVGYQF